MEDGPLRASAVLAGRYTVERRVGSGGMATVYLARDEKHDRTVAVKVLHADLARELGPERFAREITIAAQLQHPHILPLYDSGESDGLLFYVMPYVEGESLRDRLDREKQLPVDEALRLVCQLAAALAYAHRHNVLHRDIKPENILVEDGQAMLADFGIARAIVGARSDRLTSTGLALGTPTYMSPEQSTGATELDGRSDVYGLATVLYEMLTGEPPFSGSTPQALIAKRLATPPPSVRAIRPTVPADLEGVLLRALQPVPADRFASMERFAAALDACAPWDAPGRSLWRGALSRRGWRVAILAVGAVAVVSAGVWWRASRGEVASRGEIRTRTLAILPLNSMSEDPAYAYLAESFTSAVIGELERTDRLRVISHASTMRYAAGRGAGTRMGMDMAMGGSTAMPAAATGGSMPDMGNGMGPADPPRSFVDIARDLGSDLVMDGTFAYAGDTVRLAATIIDPASQRSVWSVTYVRPARDLFMLQEEFAGAVLQAVAGGGPPPEVADRRQDPAAHEAYLKGAFYQAHWNLPQAIQAFTRAVEIDPTHARAYASLARAHYFQAFFGDVAPGIALGAMRRAATVALELDSTLAEAHGQMALIEMLQEWDWDGADAHFRRALELGPNQAQIHHDYAHFLLGQGRHRESLLESAKALALDPANPMLTSCLGWHSLFDQRYDQAILYAVEANAMMPDYWAQTVLGWAFLGKGQQDSALVALREATRLSERSFAAAALAHGLAVSGRGTEARRVLAGLLRRAEEEYVSAYDIATVYAGLGDEEEVFRWLRRAAEERSTFIVHLGWDPRFDGWRSHARYQDLLEREMMLRLPPRASAGGRPAV
jgi:serine/threonine-protein kinase